MFGGVLPNVLDILIHFKGFLMHVVGKIFFFVAFGTGTHVSHYNNNSKSMFIRQHDLTLTYSAYPIRKEADRERLKACCLIAWGFYS
jgi:hypothetical protein